MYKHAVIIALFTLFLTQISYAADDNLSSNKQCSAIVDACQNAGFNGNDTSDKSFWFSCMKPMLYGSTVSGVTVDAKDVKRCRKAKIAKMKKELHELETIK